MSKISALTKAWTFSNAGRSPRDQYTLFLIAFLNQLDHRRRRLRAIAAWALDRVHSSGEHCVFTLKLGKSKYHRVICRLGDMHDYQSIWECLTGNMYETPEIAIKHIFDAGGNIGLFTLNSIANNGNIESAIVVELDPENVSLIKKIYLNLGI